MNDSNGRGAPKVVPRSEFTEMNNIQPTPSAINLPVNPLNFGVLSTAIQIPPCIPRPPVMPPPSRRASARCEIEGCGASLVAGWERTMCVNCLERTQGTIHSVKAKASILVSLYIFSHGDIDISFNRD